MTTAGTQTAFEAPAPARERQQAVHFAFYRLRPAWWELTPEARRDPARELLALLDEWSRRLLVVSYTSIGIRTDADLLLWKAAAELEEVQGLGLAVVQSAMGRYLEPTHHYLSLTKRSVYVRGHRHEGQDGNRLQIAPIGAKYLFVYPFVKTRAWYALSLERRQEMMNEHIRVGHKYPRVKLNTTYSFGLDDQEFVLAFESDHVSDFLDLVMELRETEASQYTLRDTPIFTCMRAEGEALLRAFGAA
jgi:chlorite dismutase